jgi:3D (Asp-Asp-Asp) domain-containing protein
MRRNALTLTLTTYSVLLVLVLLSAVGKAGEKRQPTVTPTATTATPILLLASAVDVPVEPPDELLHDTNASSAPAIAAPVAVPTGPRTRTMEVTAYCPCKKCCGKNAHGVTASGLRVSHNAGLFVAADTDLKFHTKLIIPGYGGDKPVPVLDRGGAIKGNRIDVFFASHKAALEWGRRKVDVTVLD